MVPATEATAALPLSSAVRFRSGPMYEINPAAAKVEKKEEKKPNLRSTEEWASVMGQSGHANVRRRPRSANLWPSLAQTMPNLGRSRPISADLKVRMSHQEVWKARICGLEKLQQIWVRLSFLHLCSSSTYQGNHVRAAWRHFCMQLGWLVRLTD